MGSWSANVMGGDTPMDIRGTLLDVIGLDNSFWDRFFEVEMADEDVVKIREAFIKNMDRLLVVAEEIDSDDDWLRAQGVVWLVLGTLMMEYGVPMSADLRDRCVNAATEDTWAQEDDERLEIMRSFIEDITGYVDGVPTELTIVDEGLFAKIFKTLGDEE